MLVCAAVCPHPPLLVRELGPPAQNELDELRAACANAIEAVRATEPELLVVVGAGEATRSHAPGTTGSFRPYGVDVAVRLPAGRAPAAEPAALPLSIMVGAWLLEQAEWQGEVRGQEVGTSTPGEQCLELGLALAQQEDRLGLLVMGDGSARRSVDAPGYLDPRAAGFDASVVDALRAGDPGDWQPSTPGSRRSCKQPAEPPGRSSPARPTRRSSTQKCSMTVRRTVWATSWRSGSGTADSVGVR